MLLTHRLTFDAEVLHSFFRGGKFGDEVAKRGVA
jgi:hypothetical protein